MNCRSWGNRKIPTGRHLIVQVRVETVGVEITAFPREREPDTEKLPSIAGSACRDDVDLIGISRDTELHAHAHGPCALEQVRVEGSHPAPSTEQIIGVSSEYVAMARRSADRNVRGGEGMQIETEPPKFLQSINRPIIAQTFS